MSDVNTARTATRAAVNDLLTAADRCGAVWTVPRAPSKWSAGQVVEHVARILEESGNAVSGVPSKFPKVPGFLRPLVRIIFRRILKKGRLPKARAAKAFDPISSPATPAEARIRLENAFARFDQACHEAALRGKVEVTMFGGVSCKTL